MIKLTWDLPADSVHVKLCRRTVRLLLEHEAVVDDDIGDVELVLGELCANVIRHAYKEETGRYTVETRLEGIKLTLIVTDNGCGFDKNALPVRKFSEEGGMGLSLMAEFADRLEFHATEGGGSAVCAERTLRIRPSAPPQ